MTDDTIVGQTRVTVSTEEVRLWICDENGCRLRIRCRGDVEVNNLGNLVDVNVEPPKQRKKPPQFIAN